VEIYSLPEGEVVFEGVATLKTSLIKGLRKLADVVE
jgi:hypothetical protein